MEEKTYLSPDECVQPGWVYDCKNRKFTAKDSSINFKTELTSHINSLDENNILKLIDDDRECYLMWKSEFIENFDMEHMYMRYDIDYFKRVNDNKFVPIKGSVTEVHYSRYVAILICSDIIINGDRIKIFIENAINGQNSYLDYIFNYVKRGYMYIYDGQNTKKFDSLVHGLKEFIRIINESKMHKKIPFQSFTYLKFDQSGIHSFGRTKNVSSQTKDSLYTRNIFSNDISNNDIATSFHFGNQGTYCLKERKLDKIQPISHPNPQNCIMSQNLNHFESSLESQKNTPKHVYEKDNQYCEMLSNGKYSGDKYSFKGKTDSVDLNKKNNVNCIPKLSSSSLSTDVISDNLSGIELFSSNDNNSTMHVSDANNEISSLKEIKSNFGDGKFNEDLLKTGANLSSDKKINDKISDKEQFNQGYLKNNSKDSSKISYIDYKSKIIKTKVSLINEIKHVEIGNKTNEDIKVLLLLGATGSGKTSLINLFFNFYFGFQDVESKKLFIDDIDEFSIKTNSVNVFTFYSESEDKNSLTVIDTPGLNDSGGGEIQDHVERLKSFLALYFSKGHQIHAIGFVIQSHIVRLTSSEKIVMHYAKTLFKDKVEKNLITLVTFADNQIIPPVIEAMEYYGIKSQFFRFNNTLLTTKDAEIDELDKVYWKIGIKNCKKFLKVIKKMDPLSNHAMDAVKNDVISQYFSSKQHCNLHSELEAFIKIYDKKKLSIEFSLDKNLKEQRSRVWIASNITYKENQEYQNKEQFLFNICITHLQEKHNSFIPNVLLFLFLDKECSFGSVVKAVLESLMNMKKLFVTGMVTRKQATHKQSLSSYCHGCGKYCQFMRNNENLKFTCHCKCLIDLHGVKKIDNENSLVFNRFANIQKKVLVAASKKLQDEIDKYTFNNYQCWSINDVLDVEIVNAPTYLRRDLERVKAMLTNI